MDKEYQYEYEWDSKYCYPNSFILINKLGISDQKALSEAEREITSTRISQLKEHPIKGNFDLRHLQEIHRFIFQDIYDWAGELRTVNIAKGNQFCNCMYIESGFESVYKQLKADCFLIGIDSDFIYEKLAYYLGELNVVHPFREGNGRAQRVYIECLALISGYYVDFSNVTGHDMIEASADAFNCDYSKMTAIFEQITTPMSTDEQIQNIHIIMPAAMQYLDEITNDCELEEEMNLHL